MIKFSLVCDQDHSFEGWFGSSDEFDSQSKRGLISCPNCSSTKISKALMTPGVPSKSNAKEQQVAHLGAAQRELMTEMKKLRDTIIENAEHVGDRFPEEARKIHYGESEERGIYGEATRDDVENLLDEGIVIAPLPTLPEDAN